MGDTRLKSFYLFNVSDRHADSYPSGGWDAIAAWWDFVLTGSPVDKTPDHHKANVDDNHSEIQHTKSRQLDEKSACPITERKHRQTQIRSSTHSFEKTNNPPPKSLVYAVWLEPEDLVFCLKVIKNAAVTVVVYMMFCRFQHHFEDPLQRWRFYHLKAKWKSSIIGS